MLIVWFISLAIAAIAIMIFSWRALRRRQSEIRARQDFSNLMKAVHDWASERNDLALTANATNQLARHVETLKLIEQSPRPEFQISLEERHYRFEYRRCQARHEEICDLSYPDNAMYEQAMELQEAMDALEARRQSRSLWDD